MTGNGAYYKAEKSAEEGREKNLWTALGLSLAVAIVTTVLLLLLVTVLVYNTNISGTVSGILMVVIYVLAPFSGAFALGKMVKKKRFLWGLLLAGLYFIIFIVVSRVTASPEHLPRVRDYIEVLLAVLPGGILGGMFS